MQTIKFILNTAVALGKTFRLAASVNMIFVAAGLLLPSMPLAGELMLQPGITASEEYNDNVFLVPEEKKSDYITRIAPSLIFGYTASLWDWNLNYTYDYRYYSRLSDRQASHSARLTHQTRIIENYFFLDVRDTYQKVSLDVSRDFTEESNFVRQTDRNVLNISPYLQFRPSEQTTVKTGYVFQDTWYKDPESIDTREQGGYGEILQEISEKTVMTGVVRFTDNENDVNHFTKTEISLGSRFEYSEGSTLSVNAGYDWFRFPDNREAEQVFWDIRGVHKYPTITAFFEIGLRYIPDPVRILRREDRYLAGISKTTERTSFGISGGLTEYRQAEKGYLENRNYSINTRFSHAVREKTRMSYSFSINRIENNFQDVDTYTTRYLTDVRLEQSPLEGFVWALAYRYTNAYSPDEYLQNYKNNRLILELTKKF